MKKEKTIRTYQRRTKTGKVVTVKQHTAKYDAAEAMKEAAKKKGAGDELENLKKKVKSEKVKVEKPAEDAPDYGFTADEYKAWYHWDQAADPKNKTALKVEKALKKQMGTKAYNKYFDDLTDNYSARGHNKAFKGLSEKLSTGEKKAVTSGKETKGSKKEAKASKESSFKKGDIIKKSGEDLRKEGFKATGRYTMKHPDGREVVVDKSGAAKGQWKVTKEAKVQKDAEKTSKSDDEKPRMHTVKTPKGTTTLPVMKTLGKVGETRYTYDSAGNIYKPGKAGGASHIKLSDKKATEILDKLNISSRKFSAQVKESFSKGTTPKKPKSTAGVTDGASAIKYNGKTYMVTKDGSVETSTGRKVGKTLSAKVLKEKEGTTSLGIPPKGSKSKVSNKYGGMTKEEFEKRQRDFTKRVKDADKGTRAKYSFTDIKKKIKEADISDAARKRLLKSISKPYAVVTPTVMEKRLQKELDKKKK